MRHGAPEYAMQRRPSLTSWNIFLVILAINVSCACYPAIPKMFYITKAKNCSMAQRSAKQIFWGSWCPSDRTYHLWRTRTLLNEEGRTWGRLIPRWPSGRIAGTSLWRPRMISQLSTGVFVGLSPVEKHQAPCMCWINVIKFVWNNGFHTHTHKPLLQAPFRAGDLTWS